MDKQRWAGAVLAVTMGGLLAGCGGTPATSTPPAAAAASSAPSTPAVVASSAAPAPVKTPKDLPGLAAKIGCTGYAQSSTPAPNADQWGTCTLAGKAVKVYLIPTDGAYRAFLASVKAYGVSEAWMVRVAPFVVAPDDQTQIPTIKAALGVA